MSWLTLLVTRPEEQDARHPGLVGLPHADVDGMRERHRHQGHVCRDNGRPAGWWSIQRQCDPQVLIWRMLRLAVGEVDIDPLNITRKGKRARRSVIQADG